MTIFFKTLISLFLCAFCVASPAIEGKVESGMPSDRPRQPTPELKLTGEDSSISKAKPIKKEASEEMTVPQQPVSDLKLKGEGSSETTKPVKRVVSEQSYFAQKGDSQMDNHPLNRYFELGLEYPLNFGFHLRYPLSDSLYARFGLGFMPGLFLNSFEKLSPALGFLEEEETKLISDTVENSIYLDFRMAWLPYLQVSGGGPYLELGLSGMLYGSGQLKGLTLQQALPKGEFDELKKYSAKTNTFNATVHAGYQIPFEKIKLNVEVGLIKILYAHVLNVKPSISAPEPFSSEQKKIFKNFLSQKGWIFPTVSGWVSFAF